MAIDAALSAPWDGEVKNLPQPVQARVQCSALSLDGPTPAVFQLAEAAWVRSDPGINAFAGIPAAALGSRTTRADRAITRRELMPHCDQVLVTLNTRRLIGLPYASFTALRHVAAIL
jgi:hypothetical protein